MKGFWVSCVVAAVSGTFCAAQAQEGWPLAVRIMSYGKFQEAAWTHLPSIGVHYIFLSIPEPDKVDAELQRLRAHNLTPLVLRGNAEVAKATFVDDIAPQLAVCEKMGVKYMFLSAKRENVDKTVVYERLRKAGDVAQKHGVTIVLETHPDLGTNGDVQLETMKAVNHPNVRVNFDTGNITFYNKGTDALTELKKIVDYVATMEFKDHSGGLEEWNFPILGKGKVDFPAIVKVLKEHKFSGPVTIEFEGTKGVELNEEQTKSAIADCVKYVGSLAAFR